jgi:hypothetical protein
MWAAGGAARDDIERIRVAYASACTDSGARLSLEAVAGLRE